MMTFDYTTLIFPSILLGVFGLKYLVKRLYKWYFARKEVARVENLNRLLRDNPLLYPYTEETSSLPRPNPKDRLPPPPYEIAIQLEVQDSTSCIMPIYCIQIQDETPPPTYDDWLKMSHESLPPSYRLPPLL